jgi:toxic protein SymE
VQNSRKLKIHTKYRSRRFDWVPIPEIRLEGKWLENLGFTQGQTVSVELKQNKLTITICDPQK